MRLLLCCVALLSVLLMLLMGCNSQDPTPQPLPPVIVLCEPGLHVRGGQLWICTDKHRMEPFPMPSPLMKNPPQKPEKPKQQI